MKLKQYAEEILKLAEEYPDAEVVYSSDDEGNRFDTVAWIPSAGHYQDREFHTIESEIENAEDQGYEFDESEFIINAVCLN